MSTLAELFSDKGVGTAAVVGGIGWLLAYLLNGYRDDKARRVKITIDHSAEQIKEFYAPLVSLTDQLDSLASIIHMIAQDNTDHRLNVQFYKKFFFPVHQQINQILSTKLHLFEGKEIPDSFKLYFEHYAAEYAVYELNDMKYSFSSKVVVPGYPSDFYWDVRKGFQTVLNRYEEGIRIARRPFSN